MSETVKVLGVSASGIMSGAERVLYDYATSGSERGEQWTVAVPRGRFRQELVDAGIAVVDLPVLHVGEGSRFDRLQRSLRSTVQASRVIRRVAPTCDVVVVNSVRALPALLLTRRSTPVGWLIHDVIEREGIRRLVRLAKSTIDLAIGVSNASVAFAESIGIPSTVIVNGTRWPVEPATGGGPGEIPIVGINAAITPWKGHRVFLEAADLVTTEARFEVLGGAPFDGDRAYESELAAQAGRLGCADRVAFLGQQDDPRAVMRRWAVSVSASIEPEAGPLAILESMSLGLPVVVTDHGGGPELAANAGLVVPPGDARALAEAIESLLSQPDRRAELGRLGRNRVRDLYSADASAERFGLALRSLAEGETP